MGNASLGNQSSAVPLPGGAVENESLTIAELAASLRQFLVPTGSVLSFAGASAPSGFLVCNGDPVSRETYIDLFDVLGTIFGAGNGSSTFNLPDFRGRVPVGAGNDNIAANNGIRNLGTKGGDTRLQGHTHVVNASGSGTTAGSNSSLNHNHGYAAPATGGTAGVTAGQSVITFNFTAVGAGTDYRDLNHTHNFSVATSGTSNNHNQSIGDGQNMQPYQVVNYIIKF
jgi:microcystin-dependent protein